MGDEPTGYLDQKNNNVVFQLFKELAEEYPQALLIVTHDLDFAANTQRTITLEDGKSTGEHHPPQGGSSCCL